MSATLKIIDKIDPIAVARQNYDVITKECQIFLQALQKFQIAFNSLADLPIPEIPTLPNTSLDGVINEHLNSLLQFSQAFQLFSLSLKDDCDNFEKIFQLRQNQRESIDNEIKSLNNSIVNLLDKNVEGNILELRDQLNKKINLLRKSFKNRAKFGESSKSQTDEANKTRATSELEKAYSSYYQDLLNFKSKKVKLNRMISKMQTLITNYFSTLRTTDSTYRAQLVSDGLRSIAIHVNDLGNSIDKSLSSLQSEKLEFNNDFTYYAENLNIEFKNIPFPQGVGCIPINRSTASLETSDHVNVSPYRYHLLPDYIASLKAEFKGENLNELTVRKGQKVGILNEKDPSEGWTLCMNLFSKNIGYIPTQYLEKVGQGLAIVKNDQNLDNFDGDSGRLLSFIEKKGEDEVLCEDYCGRRAFIPISDVIVLC